MQSHRVLPILLLAGAAMLIMGHKRHEFMGQCEEGEHHHPIGPRGEWGKRVPPFFEMWHRRAHEQEQAAPQPPAPAPAV